MPGWETTMSALFRLLQGWKRGFASGEVDTLLNLKHIIVSRKYSPEIVKINDCLKHFLAERILVYEMKQRDEEEVM